MFVKTVREGRVTHNAWRVGMAMQRKRILCFDFHARRQRVNSERLLYSTTSAVLRASLHYARRYSTGRTAWDSGDVRALDMSNS